MIFTITIFQTSQNKKKNITASYSTLLTFFNSFQLVDVIQMDLLHLHVAQVVTAFAKLDSLAKHVLIVSLGSLAKHVPIVSLGFTNMELIAIVIFHHYILLTLYN